LDAKDVSIPIKMPHSGYCITACACPPLHHAFLKADHHDTSYACAAGQGQRLAWLMDILKSFDLKKKKKDKKKCCEKFRKGKRCGSCPMKGCA
jgi:hypothetical protein